MDFKVDGHDDGNGNGNGNDAAATSTTTTTATPPTTAGGTGDGVGIYKYPTDANTAQFYYLRRQFGFVTLSIYKWLPQEQM